MTTATLDGSPFSYASDPSGAELRKALLLPPRQALAIDRTTLLLTGTAAAILLGGILRIALS